MSQFSETSSFAGVDSQLLNAIYRGKGSMPKDADFVFGHLAASTTFDAYPNAQHITLLREPLTRLMSLYLYWRGLNEDDIAPWGDLRARVYASHAPLAAFLANKRLACQVDNCYVRMLLWPHPLIPERDWIAPRNDHELLDSALRQLDAYAYVDVIENPAMPSSLQAWIGAEFDYSRRNVTAAMSADLRLSLDQELTMATTTQLMERSRLDLRLWQAVAARRCAAISPSVLQLSTLMPVIARYSLLTRNAGPLRSDQPLD